MAHPGPAGNRFEHSRGLRLALLFGGILIGLLAGELAARLYVAARWSPARVYAYTHHTGTRGRYTVDSILGYRGTPGFRDEDGRYTHNAAGFRGPPFEPHKPAGAVRIVLLGASTAYGHLVADRETIAWILESRLRARFPGTTIEVLNAAVPNWTSRETVLMLEHRVLPLEPDLLLILDGRNDVFPQLFRDYRDDYSHYRTPGYDFRRSNYLHKRLFRFSHLFMLLAAGEEGRFGFDGREENPLYSSTRYDHVPSRDELVRYAGLPERMEGYRRNVAREVGLAHAQQVSVMFATMPFAPERFRSSVLGDPGPDGLQVLARQVERNNEIVRAVARDSGAIVVETALLARQPGLLRDDCHFTPAGSAAFVDLVLPPIERVLADRLDGPATRRSRGSPAGAPHAGTAPPSPPPAHGR